jgi:predicted GTPase
MLRTRSKKDFQPGKLADAVRAFVDGDAQKPLTVSVMGQTGVGKSSLINALFGTKLTVNSVEPGTITIEQIRTKGRNGQEIMDRLRNLLRK